MSDPYARRNKLIELLNLAIAEIKKRGIEKANAERDYRVALRKLILTERANGTPVTIISDLCRGEETVADLKKARDIADSLYESAQEALQTYKLELRVVQEDLTTERRGG